jgi:hypothetical protein
MDTGILTIQTDLGIVVPFFIDVFRHLKDLPGTELNAQVAAFTAFEDEVNATFGDLKLVQIHRSTREYLHAGFSIVNFIVDIPGTPANIIGE